MNATRRLSTPSVLAGALFALVVAPASAAAAQGFFDGLPRRGYVLEDVSYLVNRAGDGVRRDRVATLRFLRLALDPGTRGVAQDLWPEREMLLVEHATGELVAFERILRASRSDRPGEARPLARVGLEGTAVELLARGDAGGSWPGRPLACAGAFHVLSSRGRDLPVAPEDLGAPTVREGIVRFVDAALDERERDLVGRTAQIALRAGQARALPLGSLDVLKTVFPGRRVDPWPEALVFDPPPTLALDPSAGAWRSVTEVPEVLAGAPLY